MNQQIHILLSNFKCSLGTNGKQPARVFVKQMHILHLLTRIVDCYSTIY